MEKHKLLKKISLGIASLALICPLAMGNLSNNTHANAADENGEFTELAHILHVNAHKNIHKYYHGHYFKTYGMSPSVNGHVVSLAKAISIAKSSRRNHRHYHHKRYVRHHVNRRRARKHGRRSRARRTRRHRSRKW